MATNRTAELQLRGRAGTLQGRVYWPGPSLARHARLMVFWTVAGDGTWCQELSAGAGLVVLAVICGRPYPANLDDAVTAAEWAAENTARLGADPGELLVGGAGPGGTLAAGDDADDARWFGVRDLDTVSLTTGLKEVLYEWGVVRPVPSYALVAEATRRAGVVWLTVPGQDKAYPAWHLWREPPGAAYLVTGPGEQPLPGLAGAGIPGRAAVR